tara:strand:+ start:309 stop:803 length:495 start_codon:yes stop_codon:yes gene_type:complete
MAAAVLNDLPIAPDVIEVGGSARFGVQQQSRSLGSRFVGITTVLGVITLTIILGHALFNARLQTQVVEIDRLDKQIALQEESVRELRLKYENAVAPLKIERLAYGQLALLPAESATQIRLRSEHIALNKDPALDEVDQGDEAQRFSMDPILAEALTIDPPRSAR